MGCWNHTCAVTNLPIHYEEEVEVILLKSTNFSADSSSFCYPYSNYTPLPLTFSGTYNDYGAVENCKGAALDTIIESLRGELNEELVIDDEDARYKTPITKETFSVENMFELDHEKRLYIKSPYRAFPDSPKTTRIRHIVVRKDVYDGIVNKVRWERWWDTKKFTTLATLDTDAYTKDIDNYNDSIVATGGNAEEDLIRRSLQKYRGIGDSQTCELLKYEGNGSIGMNLPINVNDTLLELRTTKSDLYDGILENATRFAFFDLFMHYSRKSYGVPSGAGAQDDSTKNQELCARLTLSSAKAQRKWLKEKYEE